MYTMVQKRQLDLDLRQHHLTLQIEQVHPPTENNYIADPAVYYTCKTFFPYSDLLCVQSTAYSELDRDIEVHLLHVDH